MADSSRVPPGFYPRTKGTNMSDNERTPPRGGRRPRTPARLVRSRSAVSSSRRLFIGGDPNSALSRRYHDLVVGYIADAGGQDMPSDLASWRPECRPARWWIWI